MKTIETKWNLGNFTVNLAADVNEELEATLLSLGLLYIGQRVSEVDKVLGGFTTVDGKSVRRKDWKRTDAAFTPDLAEKLADVFGELSVPGTDSTFEAIASVTEYVPQTAESKFAGEKAACLRHEKELGDLPTWASDVLGFVGEVKDEKGEYSTGLLVAVRERKRALLKGM